MNSTEVGKLVAYFAAAYPSWRPPPETVAVWSAALAGVEPEVAERAARRAVVTLKFAPSVAEFIELVVADASPTPTPVDVMAEILAAVHTTPWERHPEGLSAVALDVVAAIGWRHITDSENPEALRAHLLRVAEIYCRRASQSAAASIGGLPPPVNRPALAPGQSLLARWRGEPRDMA